MHGQAQPNYLREGTDEEAAAGRDAAGEEIEGAPVTARFASPMLESGIAVDLRDIVDIAAGVPGLPGRRATQDDSNFVLLIPGSLMFS